ncbi:MAG TPA: DUF4124 domain-containing protein [Burkholderiales bacterium]
MQYVHPFAALLALAFLQPAAWAETCKYQDSEGRVIYSNTPNNPPKGAKKIKCFEDPAAKHAPANASSQSAPPNTEAKARLPRVSEGTQKARDDERRRILEQEVADEIAQLAHAKEELAAQEAVRNGDEKNYQRYLDRIKPYQDAVATHERNIEAIQREIANLK